MKTLQFCNLASLKTINCHIRSADTLYIVCILPVVKSLKLKAREANRNKIVPKLICNCYDSLKFVLMLKSSFENGAVPKNKTNPTV